MYGTCTLSVVICIPEGEARGNTYNYGEGHNPYTLETHDTADLYHDSISQCFPDSWESISNW